VTYSQWLRFLGYTVKELIEKEVGRG